MHIYRNITALCALAALLDACGGSHAVPAALRGASASSMAQVAFSIALPAKTPSARHPYYVSGSTAYAEINVKNASAFNQNTEITCAYPMCSGTVAAPIGNDTFAVTLVDSSKTEVLSTGTVTQSISAGSNTVKITFNPVPTSISLLFDSSAWPGGASPALDPNQHTSMLLDLTATDAAGNTIVGPGAFVDAGGNPITVTLSDGDVSTTLSNTTFTSPGGTTTLAVKSGVQHASPYEDAIITVSAPGVANVKGLAVAFAPTMLNVGKNSAFGALVGTYRDTATAAINSNPWTTDTQVDFNAVGGGGLVTQSVPGGGVQANCGSISNPVGGTSDGMLYFITYYGTCGNPPPNGFPGNNLYQADPSSHNINAIVTSSNGLSGPLGVGADGNIWYVEVDGSPNYLVHLCHYAGGSNSCTSGLPQGTQVYAFLSGPGGETMAVGATGPGRVNLIASISSTMTVTTHDLSSQLSYVNSIGSWGYSPSDKQLYLWGDVLVTIDTNTWQVTSTTPIFPGNPGSGLAAETGSGVMTVLNDGSLVAAGGNGGGYGGGVNGVIFHIHPGANGPVVSQETPLLCSACSGIADSSALLPDGTITEVIASGTDIEYTATW